MGTVGWLVVALGGVALIVWGTAPLAYPESYTPRGRSIGGIVVVPQNLVMLGVPKMGSEATMAVCRSHTAAGRTPDKRP